MQQFSENVALLSETLGGITMATTQPIKDVKELEELKDYYLTKQHNYRNYALFVLGINTALRIGDILSLTWNDVLDFNRRCFRNHITVKEHKTGKENRIAINENVKDALKIYLQNLSAIRPSQYIFPGRNGDKPLSREQAFRIIKNACSTLHLSDNISCHSLRKTFGYHAWAAGTDPVVLMLIFNHSDFQITKRYLGIDQDDKDKVFLNLNL